MRLHGNLLMNVGSLVACCALGLLIARPHRQEPMERRGPRVVDVVDNLQVSISHNDRALGSGPATVVEFSDFQCPYCGLYARNTFPELRRDFVDNGRIRYIFRHLPLAIHPLAERAAVAAECAFQQGHFWEMHDLMFARQAQLRDRDIREFSAPLGLNRMEFEGCLENERTLANVARERADAARLGVVSTPTFLLGRMTPDGTAVRVSRRLTGAQPYSVFTAVLQDMLKSTDPSPHRDSALEKASALHNAP